MNEFLHPTRNHDHSPAGIGCRARVPLGSGSTRMTAVIQPVRVARDNGSNPTVLPSFERLDIWRRCCADFTIAAPSTINSTAMQIVDDTGGAPTAEELALSAAGPAGTLINVIIVKNFDTGGESSILTAGWRAHTPRNRSGS